MANGWWNNNGAISGTAVAYDPIQASSLADSYINRFNPGTNDAAPGTAPTWAYNTGWSFNGTTQYLVGYTPPNQAAFTLIVRFSGGSTATVRALVCTSDGTNNLGLFSSLAASGVLYANSGQVLVTPSLATGVLAVAGGQGYRNGSADGASFTPTGRPWSAMAIGRRNNNNDFYFDGSIQAVAMYTTDLTAGEVATVTTAMNALPAVTAGKGLPVIADWHAAQLAGGY